MLMTKIKKAANLILNLEERHFLNLKLELNKTGFASAMIDLKNKNSLNKSEDQSKSPKPAQKTNPFLSKNKEQKKTEDEMFGIFFS